MPFVGVESRNDDDVDEHDDDVFLRGGDGIKDDGDDDDDDDDDFCVGINPLWDPHAIPSGSLPFSSSDVAMCLLLALDAASDEVEVAAICFCVGVKDDDDEEEEDEEDDDEDCGGSCRKDDYDEDCGGSCGALRFDDDDDEDDVLPP